MNQEEIIIESKIKSLKLKEKEKNKARKIMSIAGFDKGGEYLSLTTSLRKTAAHRNIEITNIDVENPQNLIKQVNGAINSFQKIIKTDNKENRQIIKDIIDNGYPLDDFLSLSEKKREFKQLIKQKNISFDDKMIDLKNALNDKNIFDFHTSLEYQNDEIEKSIIISNANKLKRTILSKKYNHLVNKETEDIFLEAAKQGVTRNQMRNSVAPKIAAMKNPDDFNELLGNVIGMNIIWDDIELERKAIHNNTDVIQNENGIIYLEIDNFSDSQSFGSRMWCITREDEYLKNYLYKDNSRIVFQLDTNRDIKDPESYVAMLYKGNKLSEVYDKNDISFTQGSPLFDRLNKIDLPAMSQKSKSKKRIQYEQIVKDKESFNMNNLNYLSLVDIKAFDLLKFYEENKDNGYYELEQDNLYSSDSQQSKFESYVPLFDEEQITFINNSPNRELLSGYFDKTSDILLSQGLKHSKNKGFVDFLFEKFIDVEKLNKDNKKALNEGLSNENNEIFKHFISRLKEENINIGHVLSSTVNKDINDSNINILTESDISDAMSSNNRTTFINLFSNSDRKVETIRNILKNPVFKEEDNKILIDKFVKRIERNSYVLNSDKSFMEALNFEDKDKTKKTKKIKY